MRGNFLSEPRKFPGFRKSSCLTTGKKKFLGLEFVVPGIRKKFLELDFSSWEIIPHFRDFHYFNTCLIPLNKIHPETPTPKDCRPIAVCSALIKLLESRVRKKPEQYMVEKLHRGQTGFVPGMVSLSIK